MQGHLHPPSTVFVATYIQNIREHIHRFTQEQDFINAHLVFLDTHRYFFARLNKKTNVVWDLRSWSKYIFSRLLV